MSTLPGQPPPYPMAPAATPDRMRRPAAVTAAFWLVLAGAVLVVVTVATALQANLDDLERYARESLIEDREPFTENDVQSQARFIAFGSTLFAAVFAAPYLVFAPLMRGGRNWARVTLTVLVSIGGFVTALLIIAPLGLGVRLAEVAVVAMAVVIIVLMFTQPANQYFDYRPPPPQAWYPAYPAPPTYPDMRG